MTIYYAREQAWKALSALATGTGSIQERCVNAMTAGLIHVVVAEDDLPDDLAERWHYLQDRATSTEAVANEGTLVATLGAMDDDEAQEFAREIFEWCIDLVQSLRGD